MENFLTAVKFCFENPRRLFKWIFWICLISFIFGFLSKEPFRTGGFPSAIVYSSIGLLVVIIGNGERNKREAWLLNTKDERLGFSGQKEKHNIIKDRLKKIFKENEKNRRLIIGYLLEQSDFSKSDFIERLEKEYPKTLSAIRGIDIKNEDSNFKEINNLERLLLEKFIKNSSPKVILEAGKYCPEILDILSV